ncbi:MAG: cyclase family protein [bacterium]|nr:cyclase family protein [bacterium]
MPFIDITIPLSAKTPTWRNEQPLMLKRIKTIEKDGANVTSITIGSHGGTHIDAPKHFVRGGASIDKISLIVVVEGLYLNGVTADEYTLYCLPLKTAL